MTTIIRATGVTFNNPDLPVVTPIITNGLVGAFRPSNKIGGLVDVSGNGHKMTMAGAPELTSISAKGDKNNGFITDIPDSKDITLMCVSRSIKNPSTGRFSGFVLSNYSGGNDLMRGGGIWYHDQSAGSVVTPILKANSYTKKISDGTYVNATATPKTYTAGELIDGNETAWNFTAMTLNTVTNKQHAYMPATSLAPVATYDHTAAGFNLAQRKLTLDNGQPNFFRVINILDSGNWTGTVEVAEVMVFDRALSDSEIMQQYLYSKQYMAANRGITI